MTSRDRRLGRACGEWQRGRSAPSDRRAVDFVGVPRDLGAILDEWRIAGGRVAGQAHWLQGPSVRIAAGWEPNDWCAL